MPSHRLGPASGPSLEGLAGAVVGFTAVYLGVEAVLPEALHPSPWVVTLLGGALGSAIGHADNLWRKAALFFRAGRDGRRHGRNLGSWRD